MKRNGKIKSFRHNHYIVLVLRLVIVLLSLAISRMALFYFKVQLFSNLGFRSIDNAFLQGLRLDSVHMLQKQSGKIQEK